MSETALSIILRARDEAGKVFDALGRTIDTNQKKIEGFGKSATSLGKTLSIGLTAPITALGVVSFNAASDMSESVAKVEVVFGEAGDAVKEFADDAAVNLGMSKQNALEAAGTFGNLFTALGLGKETAAGMSTELLQLSADLGSFNNMDPTEVLTKLRSGLVGEVEPLRALGINLNQAMVEAKALEMGLAATTEELTPAMLTQARYALILEQTTTAQGDYARQADGAANSMRTAKAQAQDLAAEFGQELLPVGIELIGMVRGALSAFSGLSPEMKTTVVVGAGMLAMLGPLATTIGTVIGLVTNLTKAKWLWHAAQVALNFVLSANPIGLVVVAIAGLTAAVIWAYQNVEWFRDIVDTGFAVVQSAVEGAMVAGGQALDAFGATTQSLGTTVTETWEGIKGAVKSSVNAIIGFVNGLIEAWNRLEFTIPGFGVELPSVDVPGVGTIGGGHFGWPGITIGTPDVPAIPYLAAGTRNWTGGLALVGERGPELVALPRGADVYSNRETQAMMRGGDTYNINIHTSATSGTYLADIAMARAMAGA